MMSKKHRISFHTMVIRIILYGKNINMLISNDEYLSNIKRLGFQYIIFFFFFFLLLETIEVYIL